MKKWLNEKASLKGVRSRAQQANDTLAHPWIDPLSRENLPHALYLLLPMKLKWALVLTQPVKYEWI
jgi:hypothetical protein